MISNQSSTKHTGMLHLQDVLYCVICPDRNAPSEMHCTITTRCQPNILCEQQDVKFTPNLRDEVSHPKAEKQTNGLLQLRFN